MAAAWNVFTTVLAILYRRLLFHRPISLLIDSLVALSFFILNNDIHGSLIWIGLFVIVTASVYYEWRGSLALMGIITVAESVWVYLLAGSHFDPASLVILLVYNLVSGLGATVISAFLASLLRARYTRTVEKRVET